MRRDFEQFAVYHFKDGDFDIHGIPGVADQRAFVPAEVAKVEKAPPSGGGSAHEKPRRLSS